MRRLIPVILSLCLLLALVVPVGAAEPMSDQFKEYLNVDGKLPIPSMVPPNEEYAMVLGDLYYESGFYLSDWTDDFRSCRMTVWELDESHEVEVEYLYDPAVAEVAKELIATFPEDMENFRVQDMELVNYWIHTAALALDPDTDVTQSLDNYSGQLKALLKNMNFRLVVDNRAGDDSPFWIERKGIATLVMEDAIYYIHPYLGVRADHVIYLPEDTADDADSLVAALQKRMDEYAPDKVKVELGGNDIKQFFLAGYDADIARCQQDLDAAIASGDQLAIMTAQMYLDWAIDYKNYFVDAWDDPSSEYAFLKTAAGGYYFTAQIGDTEHKFIAVKDDDRMLSPTYASADAKTDIAVSTTDTSVPLDTQIRVEKLTEGAEYERIVKALDGKTGLTYDITLYSQSLDEPVTKLADDNFEVRIPVPDSFDGQELAVYYIDEQEQVEEHTVTVEENYAVFMTYHFSAYTLAPKTVDGAPTDAAPAPEPPTAENPKTGDAAWLWGLMAVLSLSVAVTLIPTRKKG